MIFWGCYYEKACASTPFFCRSVFSAVLLIVLRFWGAGYFAAVGGDDWNNGLGCGACVELTWVISLVEVVGLRRSKKISNLYRQGLQFSRSFLCVLCPRKKKSYLLSSLKSMFLFGKIKTFKRFLKLPFSFEQGQIKTKSNKYYY